jgi:hypothetical protein
MRLRLPTTTPLRVGGLALLATLSLLALPPAAADSLSVVPPNLGLQPPLPRSPPHRPGSTGSANFPQRGQ